MYTCIHTHLYIYIYVRVVSKSKLGVLQLRMNRDGYLLRGNAKTGATHISR